MCLAEWAIETGIKRETIARRLNAGETPETALGGGSRFERVEFRGERLTRHEIAERVGIPASSFMRRLRRHNGDIETAIQEWNRNGRGKKAS